MSQLNNRGGKSSDTQHSSCPKYAVVGKGMLANNALLSPILNAHIIRWYPWSQFELAKKLKTTPPDAFIGWGRKKSFKRAGKIAKRQHRPVVSIEDGFLRSLASGINSRFGLSMVMDDVGIYFDLTQPSRLESLVIDNAINWSDNKQKQAKALIQQICDNKLSKYNSTQCCPDLNALWYGKIAKNTPKTSAFKHQAACKNILVIDQVIGDASIKGAAANKAQFKKMLLAACQNHANANIWIKAHPAGKAGYLTELDLAALKVDKRVQVLKQAVNPIALLKQIDEVYTVSSHMGFEALMLGKKVHCFGVSWYSGWGLTDDSHAPQKLLKQVQKRRQDLAVNTDNPKKRLSKLSFISKHFIKNQTVKNQPVKKQLAKQLADKNLPKATVAQLFDAAYLRYSRYADPATAKPCDIQTAIYWLQTNCKWQNKLAGELVIYEFSRWKLPFVKDFIKTPQTKLFIKPKPRLKNLLHPNHFRIPADASFLVWGLAKRQALAQKLADRQQRLPNETNVFCMEDGFIRSNGLGATLLAPLSVVIDKAGIYYDATQPSDLENMLARCPPLTDEQFTRVQQLWQKLLTQRVSKYNVGDKTTQQGTKNSDLKNSDLKNSASNKAFECSNKRKLLIVGQVEDDLSVQYCGSAIKKNAELIKRVRLDYPDAYLIYKPHPDVEAGLRAGMVNKATLKLVDAVAHHTAMPDCLDWADEVHTISSLTGFEALLRGLDVVCYGLPFYAGWGLTKDIDTHLPPKSNYIKRRQRRQPLTIEQLIYCALIRYPLYRLPNGYGLAQPEQVIDYLYPSKSVPQKAQKLADKVSKISLKNRLKQHINTKFMQQRHKWKQRF